MQHLEVSCAVRRIYMLLGAKLWREFMSKWRKKFYILKKKVWSAGRDNLKIWLHLPADTDVRFWSVVLMMENLQPFSEHKTLKWFTRLGFQLLHYRQEFSPCLQPLLHLVSLLSAHIHYVSITVSNHECSFCYINKKFHSVGEWRMKM